jgi:hypothetical protein
VQAASALVVTVATGLMWAAPARGAGAFTASTVNAADNWSAQKYFTCASAVAAAGPFLYYKLADNGTAGGAADSSGNVRTGSYQGSGTATGVAGPCVRDGSSAVTLNGSTGWISTPSSVANPATFTEELWFKTTTNSGGELIGFGNTKAGTPTSYDRHIYMTNAGQLVFAVYPNTVKTISSTAAYNDGAWHLAAATLSPTAGMTLYVDGVPVATDPSTTTAQNYSGYWRIGYNNLAGWISIPTSYYFAGTIAQAAVYTSALTSAQIADHYAAGR